MSHRLWHLMQADHDLAWELVNGLTGARADPVRDHRSCRRIALELVALQSVHEVAEEQVVWPAVRRMCAQGDALVSQVLLQEGQAKMALNELRRISPGTEEFSQCASTVASQFRDHLTYEQNQVWPRLNAAADGRALDRLAVGFEAARAGAPTRPHPHTPPWPPALATGGRVLAAFDRARDKLTGVRVPTPQR